MNFFSVQSKYSGLGKMQTQTVLICIIFTLTGKHSFLNSHRLVKNLTRLSLRQWLIKM